jgi:NAD(P)-dependent dehydrogenase (short-subunit alcohol dehydrogenase family)
VNVIPPGFTLTERNAADVPAAMRERMEKESAIRRLLSPEEIAAHIVFLCSAANTAAVDSIRVSGN